MSDFSEIIRNLRLNKNITQAELADMLGLKRSTYSTYENGTREPSISMILKMAKIFGVSVDYLMGVQEEPTAIAAHKDNGNFTPEELEKIEEYKRLLLAARPKDF